MSRPARYSVLAVAIVSFALGACGAKPKADAKKSEFNPVYDKATGKLTQQIGRAHV